MNVHVIDSDQRFRRLVLGALEPFVSRVIQSTNLREADLEIAVAVPDLIIMDCAHPDGDGLKWLEEKRQQGLKSPVFFLNSGCHSTEYFCKLVAVPGVKVVLHKPVTAARLSHVFEHHFNNDESLSAAVSQAGDIDDIEREIRELSLEYLRELPDRFRLLIRQVEDLKVGRGEPAGAKNEAHKIKGTASSYGVHDVGEQAVIIDDCLKRITSGSLDATALADNWNKLELALKEALRLAEQALEKADASAVMAPAVYDERVAMSTVGLSASRGQTIVIVDDDEDFTRRVSLILGYEDMLVYSFNDAKQILHILEFLQPDLLILDLNMPDMDGFEVCKRIRIDGRFGQLPIVFLTAQTGWETRVAAFDSGADDYIPKPVVNQELIARVRVRAEKSRLQDQVSSQSSVNKLLWQALLMVMMQQKAEESA
jgi:DNA-binding response OmpR family regulator